MTRRLTAMTADAFDNDIVCPAVYKWLKGDGPEPYSVAVASLTVLVLDLLERDRKRRDRQPTAALLAIEWSVNALDPSCPMCGSRKADGRRHVTCQGGPCGLDVALTASGYPDQQTRDAARRAAT